MKKPTFYKIITFILPILLFACAIIYVQIYGMSDDDVINRTADFWIPTCFLAIASAVFHGDTFVDAIMERDWLKVAVHILQGLIIVAAAVYCYMITTQIILIDQQINECLSSDNCKVNSELLRVQSDFISRRNWTILASLWIAYFLKGCPYLVRKISNWVHEKRGEDQ
jgi:hypothetical protein